MGKKEHAAVEPSHDLEHFPDIQCPMVNALKHVSQMSSEDNKTTKFGEDVASEDWLRCPCWIDPATD